MILEVCTANHQSAIHAQQSGARRIELCAELSVGGITPSYGLLEKVCHDLSIPVNVLVRPRGGDFVYSQAEFEIIKRDIEICKKQNCAGIVSGILLDNNEIDIERTKALVELSKPLLFTFHRAFDEVSNAAHALELLIEIGVDSVLTSGQQAKAIDGIDRLFELKEQAKDRITILPGGGISSENVSFFKEKGFSEVHASATLGQTVSQVDEIEAIIQIINS